MAIAIYQDLQGRQYWAEPSSPQTLRNLSKGAWVLVDDTPETPPPLGVDLFDREMAERFDDLDSESSQRLRAAFGTFSTGVYLPSGWGQFWLPKLAQARAGTGLARVAVAGHSIARGYYASRLGKGFAGLLTGALQQGADGGSGFQTVADTSAVMTAVGLTTGQAALFDSSGTGDYLATTGTWARSTTASGPGGVQVYATTAGAKLTAKIRGTKARITVLGTATGDTYAVTIDGVAKAPLTTVGSGPGVVEYTGLSAGTHSVVLTYTGALSNQALICGIGGENASGAVVDMYAVGGAQSSVVATTSVANWTGGPSAAADLLIVSDEANDLSASVTPDTWARNLHLFLDTVRGNKGGATGATDIVIVFANPGLFDTGNLAAEYVQRARGLAEYYGAALVNFAALGRNSYDYWTSLGYWSQGPAVPGAAAPPANGDKGHPSDAGHLYMANVLAPIVTGIAGATVPSSGLPAGGNTSGTGAAATVPAKVTGLTVGSALDGTLNAAWADTGTGGSAITDYTIQYRLTGSGSWTTWTHTASTTRSATITGLTAASSYDVQVAAVNSVGTGPFSDPVTQTASAIPPADTFNRADSSTVGSTDTGNNPWQTIQDPTNTGAVTWSIQSNQLKAVTAGGTTSSSYEVIDTGHADGTIQGTLVTAGTAGNSDPGLIFRMVDAQNHWLVWANRTGGYKLMKMVAGTYTQVGTTSASISTANDVIKVVLNGTSITVYRNGVSMFTATDAANQTGTKHGFRAANASAGVSATTFYDNFSYTTATT